jgi:hypothetical protein
MVAKLGLLKQGMPEDASRDEIHEKNSRIHLDRLKTNAQIAKELKITQMLENYWNIR